MNFLPLILLAYFALLLLVSHLWVEWKERDAPDYKKGYKRRKR